MGETIRPIGERLLVERIDGHGKETVTSGGIIIPATSQGSARTKSDLFRARVVAVSDGADRLFQGDVKPDDEVMIYTYGDGDRLYTGDPIGGRLIVKAEDVVCVIPKGAEVSAINGDISGAVAMNFDRPRGTSKRAAV